MKTYLMLDKNDITKVCGTVTLSELRAELETKTEGGVRAFIDYGHLYRGKYVLVEEDAGETSYRSERYEVFMTRGEDEFIITASGKVFIEGTRCRQLKPLWKNGRLVVRCGRTMFTVARLVAKYINGWDIEGKRIGFKDKNSRNVDAKNLMIIGEKKR